jgi:orotate phosphoribosyltransferase
MENRIIEITSNRNKNIKTGIIPGHFVTGHSHVNYYVDMHTLKRQYRMSKEAAKVFAADFANTPVDTVICLEGMQVIGAFLAESLSEDFSHGINAGNDINVITPELNSSGQMIFRDDSESVIWNKSVLVLISSASTGRTVEACLECLAYYSGNLAGVAALFSAVDELNNAPVSAVFHKDDLPDYGCFSQSECPMCRDKKKVDALINDHGYSKV